ncbi:MAG: superoxide dismutase [Sphingobacteriaceae bacterium]|nr:superoxide dismutase [Sphingobacteriaceae bacterium]
MNSRRLFLKKSGLLTLSLIISKTWGAKNFYVAHQNANLSNSPFQLPELPYAYDALEPFIDKETMQIHYTKHHQSYVNKLNDTSSTNIDYQSSDEVKCTHIDKFTSPVIRNNLGGHYNHSLFWTLLKSNPEKKDNSPSGKILKGIIASFGSYENFKTEFAKNALSQFGSGWCWLILTSEAQLKITTTPNQDNPLMKLEGVQGKPLLALDVWEHAYYLKYQNKRAEYIENWWNVVNWDEVNTRYSNISTR